MDTRIQYALTEDNVSIAYWTLGDGFPVVIPPTLPSSHLELEWQIPTRGILYEGLAKAGCKVIRYDARGVGMSQRDAVDFSVPAAIRDLDAVVQRLGLSRFALLRLPNSGNITFAYAAGQPDLVSHAIFWEGHQMDDRDSPRVDQLRTIEPILDADFDLYVKIRARITSGWEASNAPIVEEILRNTHTKESLKAMNAALAATDPVPYLSSIRAPSLVLYRIGNRQREERARILASRISNAQVLGMREPTVGTFPSAAGLQAMIEFLFPDTAHVYEDEHDHTHDLRVILFTDIVDHTVMMQRVGDEAGRAILREHESITREALSAYGGSEIKTMGDSFMASFYSASRALECAIAIQKAMAARNETSPEPLQVRVGLAAGEPIAEEDDLFGSSVILASRIAAQAKGSEIVLANVVRELATGKGFLFSDRGEVFLRGFEDPIRLYELKWDIAEV